MLDQDAIVRYARQLVLPEIGGTGQAKLAQARVLVVGAGGLGSPLLLYLAGAGIGRLGVVDDDRVELSNLHRQVLHGSGTIGLAKTESARRRLHDVNPGIEVVAHDTRLDAGNAEALVRGYDLVADGSDSFATRAAVHAACLHVGVPLVSAAIQGVSGTLTTFKAHLGPPHPCFHCLYPATPPAGLVPSCAEAGVLGPAVGALGGLQAVEVMKEVLGVGESLSGTLLLYDALAPELRRLALPRVPDCPHCGGASCG
ncbi:HesA/MoeB/ThiF family protein [Marinivivus vitaminiproducens]|uniref:HesA/MoeB/ThiF family protein n=1 Tax=Marinivivus vitaminiproducens TaxID=3035935 RepID=UPI0027981968|nr:HesA/MoeB/ThiF family protein [Geminicoccaceae bacterium SCSIO 64248]